MEKKLHVSAYSSQLQVLDLIIILRAFVKLKPEVGCYRPKRVVLSIANKHHHLAIYYGCVF